MNNVFIDKIISCTHCKFVKTKIVFTSSKIILFFAPGALFYVEDN